MKNTPNKVHGLFSKEYDVLHHARSVSMNSNINIEELKEAYEALTKNYAELVKHSEKITHIADTTQLKLLTVQRETALQKQKLEETALLKENVDRIIHHDLQTPLNAILNLPRVLLKKLDLDNNNQKLLEMIIDAGERMLEIINHSLDMYKMEMKTYDYQPIKLELINIINNIINNLKPAELEQKHIVTYLNGRPVTEIDSFYILGEELMTYCMLSNLIKNALEASPSDGAITITLSQDTYSRINIHNLNAIPKSLRDVFFEKYQTYGKKKGTGLGTYSAKLTVETMGGQINFETNEDFGTTLLISLPIAS